MGLVKQEDGLDLTDWCRSPTAEALSCDSKYRERMLIIILGCNLYCDLSLWLGAEGVVLILWAILTQVC